MSEAKILVLDIETAPIKAYVWRLWDQNVGLNQIIDNGGIICVGLKWYGSKEKFLFSDWDDGHQGMLEAVHAFMSEADAVVTYNGNRFDLPKLRGEFLLAGLPSPPPVTSIDVFQAVKKLGFISNKLAFIGPLMQMGAKLKHEGFELWSKVIEGDPRAQARMAKYCVQDVVLLEKVYKHVKGYITNHPFLGDRGPCGACDGKILQSRGYRRTKSFKIQRLQCQTCGVWQDGKREKVS